MINAVKSLFRIQSDEPKIYSRVVSDANTKTVSELLRAAAKQANEDQRQLVSN